MEQSNMYRNPPYHSLPPPDCCTEPVPLEPSQIFRSDESSAGPILVLPSMYASVSLRGIFWWYFEVQNWSDANLRAESVLKYSVGGLKITAHLGFPAPGPAIIFRVIAPTNH